MPNGWNSEFSGRMRAFALGGRSAEGVPVSIKIRVRSGCFHREHSPAAYALIDEHLRTFAAEEGCFALEEHESGPEILVFVAAATAGVTLAKSVVDLVVAITKARSEGRARGDHSSAPLELVVRRSITDDRFDEEVVLRLGEDHRLKPEDIERELRASLQRLLDRPN